MSAVVALYLVVVACLVAWAVAHAGAVAEVFERLAGAMA